MTIDENTQLCICLDCSSDHDIYIEMPTYNIFTLIDTYEKSTIDYGKSVSESVAFYMVSLSEIYYIDKLFSGNYNALDNDTFVFETVYNGKKIICSLVRGITPIGLKSLKDGYYDEYFPPVAYADFFIKLQGENLCDQKCDEIVNAYIFELCASGTLEVSLTQKVTSDDDFDFEKEIIDNTNNMRPLLLGKGLEELLKLYNKSIDTMDLELKILRLTKVLEFVSQTVIQLEKNSKVQNKLNSLKALKADANYISELGELYSEISKKYDTDSGAIRALICSKIDILEIIDVTPLYITKVHSLKKNLVKAKSDKSNLITSALEEVSQAISDTRNKLSHAKANYTEGGKECKENQMQQFSEMLNIIAIQSIRWYDTTHEDQRIF